MLIIDSLDTVSVVFSGTFGEQLTGLTLEISSNATSITTTKTFQSLLLSNTRYTEFGIDWADTLSAGEYYYYLKYEGEILDEGMLRVIGEEIIIPIYKDTMDEYKIYAN